ncbi:MAG: glutathione peroxidase [Candidatus Lumbricidophila eiseniae]|uniref:Glutathione peroxidase n=1 Tax=Candidatus Lumbricidiphila eiseniae TaxID=1969409 RepID=A0A2A6FSV8_9MICO|nr:MAG: glutathione peroxidase [Candidatus Lumbricidophila eiseniae]
MSIRDIPFENIDGIETTLAHYDKRVFLLVNVASKCGFTRQYTQLEELQKQYQTRGFTVIGFPCNQFAGQEPGTAEDIATFCSVTYGVTFPLAAKIAVNGKSQHPIFAELIQAEDSSGESGRVRWNFEKFLLLPGGEVLRFRSRTVPTDPAVIAGIERGLGQD